MIAQATLPKASDNGARPFDIRHDLLQLASLIELAFQAELDVTGNTITQDMKRLATSPFLWMYDVVNSSHPLLSGYVYVDAGRLVGNVSLGIENERRGIWNISNVAIHPDYRRRGIARRLMEACLQQARSNGARMLVLEVRTDNAPALKLYHDLGFQCYDSVDELILPAGQWKPHTPLPGLPVRARRAADWRGLYELCLSVVPTEAQSVKPIAPDSYRMGIEQRLQGWIEWATGGKRTKSWIVEENGHIVAWLQVALYFAPQRHQLQITVHPQQRGKVEQALLTMGLSSLQRYQQQSVISTISLSHPEALQVWHAAGFRTTRLLDRMVLDLRKDG